MVAFASREDAGERLAVQLSGFQSDSTVVLANPRGGVPVAAPVAQALKTPLSLTPLRRLAIPWRMENDYGFVSSNGQLYLNQALVGQVRLTPAEIQRIAHKERKQLLSDLEVWGVSPTESFHGKTVLVIDDDMDSGWMMYSAVAMARDLGASKVVAAVPVSRFRARRFVANHCDELISLLVDDQALFRTENYYQRFPPVSNEDIRKFLSAGRSMPAV